MNVILTGPRHCGKSTVVRILTTEIKGKISGFISEFDDRASVERKLLLRSIDCSKIATAVKWSNNSYSVKYETFDNFAPTLIDLKSDLIVFDELGKFESSCKNLQNAVEQAFSSPTDVIAVLRLDAPSWINDLKLRNDVVIISVNEQNRNVLPIELNSLFSAKNNV